MPYGKEIYAQARRELQRRKTQAEREAQRRHDEVEAKHPELIRIEREMAEAGHSIVYALGRPDAQSFFGRVETAKPESAEGAARATKKSRVA